IDAHDRDAGATERNRDAPGAAAKFEDRSVGLQCKVAPEGNVAPAERSRVLPVVERRVVVPAFVAFSQINSQFPIPNSQGARCPNNQSSWELEVGAWGLSGSIRHRPFAWNDWACAREETAARHVAND